MKQNIINFLHQLNEESNGNMITVSISDYVDKILAHSEIITFFDKGDLQALVAYYANDFLSHKAFITMVGVSQDARGRGLAKNLLICALSDISRKGFLSCELEVKKENSKAVRLYEDLGFKKETEDDITFRMIKHF